MRSAIDILQEAFRANTGSFVVDRTKRNPTEELQSWIAKQKATIDDSKLLPDCYKSAEQDFASLDIKTLLFRYERCLPYLLDKNRMAHQKAALLLDYCAQQPPESLRFWRALLSAYFSFDHETYPNGKANWQKIQTIIRQRLNTLILQANGRREWVTYLATHRDLLTDRPGVKFAQQSLNTGQDTTTDLREKLDVPPESWFWKQYLLTKIEVAEQSSYFSSRISEFIAELSKPQFLSVRSEGIKQLLEIYQRKGLGSDRHQGLLDLAISHWHAPYKDININWQILNDNTYQMVVNWYTFERITEFFEVLGGCKGVKDERLDFWQKYVGSVGGKFFVLMGSNFFKQERFSNIAKRYPQNFGRLSGNQSSGNNVLVFEFPNLYAVVSSQVGNALYIYDKHDFPLQLKKCNPMIHTDKKSIDTPNIEVQVIKDKTRHKLEYVRQVDRWQIKVASILARNGIYPDKK